MGQVKFTNLVNLPLVRRPKFLKLKNLTGNVYPINASTDAVAATMAATMPMSFTIG